MRLADVYDREYYTGISGIYRSAITLMFGKAGIRYWSLAAC